MVVAIRLRCYYFSMRFIRQINRLYLLNILYCL
nr:MAG TPA: hypothetical protein [Bacteriophage sp.]DAX15225.1 MAG TPA: hypothetical protein [Bacteriophage sp.]